MTKICSGCKRLLDASLFNRDKAAKDGLHCWCKNCVKNYKLEHKAEILAYSKEYNKRDTTKHHKQIYYENNKNNIIERERQKRQQSFCYKTNHNILTVLGHIITGRNKTSSCFIHLGYTKEEFLSYLESKFDSKMTWSNYGVYWELDHIIPKTEFEYSSFDDKQFKICWSLLNIRPLSISDNSQRPKDGSDVSKQIRYSILHQFDRKEEQIYE